jgi:peptidoglycan/LPS O-acetylase OafA/YrhL
VKVDHWSPAQRRRVSHPATAHGKAPVIAETPAGPKLGRRPVLDGLRGIAVSLVMLEHTGLVHNGFMGVDVFFALSGFLITTLLYEEWDRSGGFSFRRFYERRSRRLLPALFLLVGVFSILYVTADPFTGWALGPRDATTLLFVNNWIAGFGHSTQLGALNPTWSLAQEEQFYLLWPLALWLLLRRGVSPTIVMGLLLASAAALVVAVPLVHGADPMYSTYFSPLDRGAELLVGCAGAVLWHNGLLAQWRTRLAAHGRALTGRGNTQASETGRGRARAQGLRAAWVSRATQGPRPVIQALVAPLARQLAAGVLIYMFIHQLLDVEKVNERSIFLTANVLAIAVILLLIDIPTAPLTRILSLAPLRYLGKISYCLYLVHLLIHNLLVHYLPGHSTDFYAATTIGSAIVLSSLSWTLIESKILQKGRNAQPVRTIAWRAPELQVAR